MVRQAIIAVLRAFFNRFTKPEHAASLVKTLLPLSNIASEEIPELVAFEKNSLRLRAIREKVIAEVGPLLSHSFVAVYAGHKWINEPSLRRAEQNECLAALIELSPRERGRALDTVVTLLNNPQKFGIANWGELESQNSPFMFDGNDFRLSYGLHNIICSLASRKVEMVEPDRTISALLRLMPLMTKDQIPNRVLQSVLQTIKAYPKGDGVAELRRILELPNAPEVITQNRVKIAEVLRNLVTLPIASEVSAHHCKLTDLAKLKASSSTELPPIPLPAFKPAQYRGEYVVSAHFDNVFEPRLYTEEHLGFLTKLSSIRKQIGGSLPTEPGLEQRVREAIRASGLQETGLDEQTQRTGFEHAFYALRDSADFATNQLVRFKAFEPFIREHPDIMRQLSVLASQLINKSGQPRKWRDNAEGVFDRMPAEQRFALLEVAMNSQSLTSYPPSNEVHLRTLIYLSDDLDPQILGPKLVHYALKHCYVTEPGSGIKAEKIGNACLTTLAALPAGAGVPYLARILARTKYPKIRAKIDDALNAAAAAVGLSRNELDEMTVPDHGLDRDGLLRTAIADGEAVIRVVGTDVEIAWYGPGGKQLKAPSVAMKSDKDLLNEIRANAKELSADLSIQPLRLQRQYLCSRSWSAQIWRDRYLNHPLMRTLVRRLIWWVSCTDGQKVAAIADNAGDAMHDVNGAVVRLDGATIEPWHPIEATVEQVAAWRDRLEALEVTQPFAQVWREVYTLTDAERATVTYSNRWAAHILRQHQAMTLARINGWRVTHRMWVDAPNDQAWHLMLPEYGLVADYWTEGAGGDTPEVSDSGAYAFVCTDRIQFHAIDRTARDSGSGPIRAEAIALADIEPIVFSEVMRHADLLTAVASIAADPNWLDRGGQATHPSQWDHDATRYWTETNTSYLEESGKRRKAILERVIPRLKIADKLSVDDRYLSVRGTRHIYQIHIGSGACFRDKKHICIVPKSGVGPGRIWLPFEGDRTLSIILSKAVLLAADDKITDEVILRQL